MINLSYESSKLFEHLEEIINIIFHNVIKNGKLKYEIKHENNLTFYLKWLYKGKVDVISKNKDILSYKVQVYTELNKSLNGKIFHGLEGYYNLIFVSPDQLSLRNERNERHEREEYERIIIKIDYVIVGNTSYISILPHELQLIVLNRIDCKNFDNTVSSNVLSSNIYSEENFRTGVFKNNERLYKDMLCIKNTFHGFDFNWIDIYLHCGRCNLLKLYNNLNEDGIIISETNWKIDHFNMYVLNYNGDEYYEEMVPMSTFSTLIFSFRLKLILPELYTKLLSFLLKYTKNIDDHISMMNSLMIMMKYDTHIHSFIKHLDNGYKRTENFPNSLSDIHPYQDICRTSMGNGLYSITRVDLLCKSPMLLWYYLNLDNVIFVRTPEYSDSRHIDYEIIHSLNTKINISAYSAKLSDSFLICLPPSGVIYNKDCRRLSKKETISILNLLLVEKLRRNL